MHPYPHTYRASASGQANGFVTVSSAQLSSFKTAPPVVERAEHGCLIANSLRGARELHAEVVAGEAAVRGLQTASAS
jgi:hypothetical protein